MVRLTDRENVPLPSVDTIQRDCPQWHQQANISIAYEVCYNLERASIGNEERTRHARILGYLLVYLPKDSARAELARYIHQYTNDPDALFALGAAFVDYFIRPFKQRRTGTRSPPPPWTYKFIPRHERMKETKDELLAEIRQAPRDHVEAKKQAHIRDDFRCAITGVLDCNSYGHLGLTLVDSAKVGGSTPTVGLHIVPDSGYLSLIDVEEEKDYLSCVVTVLRYCGYDAEMQSGRNFYSLPNTMTMAMEFHQFFERLQLWFESTGVENQYRVVCTISRDVEEEITFTSPDPNTLPVTSPELLALQATCAKVAYYSGVAKRLEVLERDMSNMEVLSADGNAAHVLSHAILTKMAKIKSTGYDAEGGLVEE